MKTRCRTWRPRFEILEDRTVPAVYQVTGTADGLGAITPSSRPGVDFDATTLRAAVIAANNSVGIADTIQLPAGTYTLTVAGAEENAARTGDLDIGDNLNIVGAGAATTTINASSLNDRVFDTLAGTSAAHTVVSIQDLTIAGGKTVRATDNLGDCGGALRVNFFTDVTLSGDVFSNNSAPRTDSNLIFGLGGAISNDGKMTINNCRFTNNSASNSGGAIYVGASGAVTNISNSTFTGNSSQSGGAIANHQYMTILNSTFSANQAGAPGDSVGQGGAIDNNGGGNLTISNSTLSGNSAVFGGAVSNFQTLKIFSSTIAGNSGTSQGGGLATSNLGTLTLENTIVANNSTNGTGPDVNGAVLSLGHNLIGNTASSTGFSATLADRLNVDPKLAALADNGGPTQTMALLAGSPAINAANTATAATTDQRGVSRPQGPAADIGAFEAPGNQAPVANNQTLNTNEDTLLNSAVTATDADGEALTFALVAGPAHGTVQLTAATGAYTYTPSADYHGPDSFTFKANDGSADSNVATVAITVTPVNDAPVAHDDAFAVDENQTLFVSVAPVTQLRMVSDPGDFIGQGQTYDYTPVTAAFFAGTNFDNGVSIDVDPPDPGTFWFLDFAGPNNALLTPGVYLNAMRFPFQDAGHPGLDVSGNGRGSSTLTGQFTVYDVIRNAAQDDILSFAASFEQHSEGAVPALRGFILFNTTYGAGGGVLANDTDVDGDAVLTALLVSGPAHGTLTLKRDGTLSYTPVHGFNGTDSFTYRISDGQAESGIATVTITIRPVDDAPVANNDNYSTAEDTPLTSQVPGVLANDTDVDGDALSAVLVSGPAHGTLTLNSNGGFTYTPAANFNGADSFTYKANDGQLDSNVATVNITVSPVNDAPVANNDSYSTAEDTPLTSQVPGVLANDTDVDGDALSAVLVNGPSHGTLTLASGGSFTYTPSDNYNGPDSFTYQANDGQADSGAATVFLTITPVNDAPVANNDSYSTADDTPLTAPALGVLGNDTDIDGDPLQATLVSGPAHGTLTFNSNGSFLYTPAAGFSGNDTFTYRASDGSLDSQAAVTISVILKPATLGKVSGSGSVDGGARQFDMSVQSRLGAGLSFTGAVTFEDRQLGISLASTSITYLRVEEDGAHAKFRGTATVNGVSGYTFTIYVEDHGAPGRNDKFRIVIAGPQGFAYDSADFATMGGLLDSGNINVKRR
jgi:VCBS repeat-containing protein/predicted outer membrane repeat protein